MDQQDEYKYDQKALYTKYVTLWASYAKHMITIKPLAMGVMDFQMQTYIQQTDDVDINIIIYKAFHTEYVTLWASCVEHIAITPLQLVLFVIIIHIQSGIKVLNND